MDDGNGGQQNKQQRSLKETLFGPPARGGGDPGVLDIDEPDGAPDDI